MEERWGLRISKGLLAEVMKEGLNSLLNCARDHVSSSSLSFFSRLELQKTAMNYTYQLFCVEQPLSLFWAVEEVEK